jgi:two-component system cell cycle sensor histidine kinase/response regulator CckA
MVRWGCSQQPVVMGDRRGGATSRRPDSSDFVVEQVESPVVDDSWPPAFLVATMAPVDVMAPREDEGIEKFTRVLLVDDEEDEFVLARDLLRRAGPGRFKLEWASTFDAGMDLLSVNLVDVCLVDYRLGSQTGLDFIREAQSTSAVPLILMTGRGDRAIDADAIAAGAADYLDKSELTPALLERSIRYAIDRATTMSQLRKSEELHRSIIASTPEGLLVLSAEGRIVAANPAAGRILQIVPAALIGRSGSDDEWDWLDPEGASLVGRNHPLLPVKERPVRSRIVGLRRRDGTVRWLGVSTGSMREASRDAAFVVSLEDVTDARDAAQRLAQVDRVDALDRLAGGIAHDFNNLVTVMRGHVDLLMHSHPLELDREVLADLSSTTDRAGILTRRLLDLRGQSRGDAHVIDLVAFVATLGGIVCDVVGSAVDVALTELTEEALVRIDPTRLEHAILNLAANARDAMPDGGHLDVIVAIEPAAIGGVGADHRPTVGEQVSLTVRDSGEGMDAETLARVFEPYFSTKGRGKGTGLGLASVYGTVQDSGGDITIDSSRGEGTTVRILLPRVASHAPLSS